MQPIRTDDSSDAKNTSETVPIAGRPDTSSPRTSTSRIQIRSPLVVPEKNFKLRMGICCVCVCVILLLGVVLFKNKYDSVMEDRETVDTRIVTLTYPVTDYSVEPPLIHNCSHSDSCSYDCETVRDKFLEDKKACEYKDYFHALRIIFEILLVVGLIGCICGKD